MTVNIVIFIIFSYSSDYPEQFVSAPTIRKMTFIVKQFKNSTHNLLILCRIEKMVYVVLFCGTRLDLNKSYFNGP